MDKKIYSKEDLITRTLRLLNKGRNDFAKIQRAEVELIIRAYETAVKECLQEATDKTEIETKPLNGLKINSTFKPARTIRMYGDTRQVKEKISVKAKITKYFGYFTLNQN